MVECAPLRKIRSISVSTLQAKSVFKDKKSNTDTKVNFGKVTTYNIKK